MTSQQTPRPGSALLDVVAVMDRLRSPGGCGWDAAQTHASLAPYAIEEAHEVADAAERGSRDDLAEELGDLLLQVLFHARIASEDADGFDIDDVARGLRAKLVRRHPHVFAERADLTAGDVAHQWEQIKTTEKQRAHPLDDIPPSLPALARAQKVVSRLRRAGLDAVPAAPAAPDDSAGTLGAELFALAARAHAVGIDAEAALRAATRQVEAAHR